MFGTLRQLLGGGSGGSAAVGGEVRWYKKMNTVSFLGGWGGWPESLELVVPSQSFAEVGHLAADKQVVLVQNFRFGQLAVLKGRQNGHRKLKASKRRV